MEQGMCERLKKGEVMDRFKNIHGNKYIYYPFEYKRVTQKIKIKCNICNSIYMQEINSHLQGTGCRVCGSKRTSIANKLTTEEFIFNANNIHNYKYDYSNSIYDGKFKPLIIICPVHGEFEMTPRKHVHLGYGCLKCKRKPKYY